MTRILVLTIAVYVSAFSTSAQAIEPARCFANSAAISQTIPMLAIESDGLAQRRAEAGDPGPAVYLLTRQLAVLERIARRAEAWQPTCEAALEAMRRDVKMFKLMAEAFKDGNGELSVVSLNGDADQHQLQRILDLAAQLESAVEQLQTDQ